MKRKQSAQLSTTFSENLNVVQNYAKNSKMLSSVNTSSNNSLNNIASSSNTSSNNTSGNISVSLSRGDAELVPQVEFLDSQPMNLQLKELSRKVENVLFGHKD